MNIFLSNELLSKLKGHIRRNNNNDKVKFGREGTFTIDDFLEKIREQQSRCYVCRQEFKYDGEQWCYFFPSVDRIDNKKIHSKDNIAIACFFCNVRMFKRINEKKCGLCKIPGHSFEGQIQTKSELFKRLHHSDSYIKEYIHNLGKQPTPSTSL